MSTMSIGPVVVDMACRMVKTTNGHVVRLTGAEFLMLAALIEANGEALGRAVLCAGVLNRPWGGYLDRSVDQLAFQLRRKLPSDKDGLPVVRNLRGRGYWVQPAPEAPSLPEGEGTRRAREFLRRAAMAELDCPDAKWVGRRVQRLLQARLARHVDPVRSVLLILPSDTPGAPPRQTVATTFRQVGDVVQVMLPGGFGARAPEKAAPASEKPRRKPLPAFVGISERVPDPAKAIQQANGARVR